MIPAALQNPDMETHARRLLHSFELWTGKPLLAVPEKSSEVLTLFNAPLAVVSHGIQADPIFNFGNAMALKLWEMSWEDFISTPSRLSAEAPDREERARLLDRVTRHGYVDDYQGVRISKTGRRFRIEKAFVWNVVDEKKDYCGQAAAFGSWKFL